LQEDSKRALFLTVLSAGIVAAVLNLIIPQEVEDPVDDTSSVDEVDLESSEKRH